MKRHRLLSLYLCLLLLLLLSGRTGQAPVWAQSDALCFPQTGYCIAGTIRVYWEQHGGLVQFGYPLGNVRTERVGGWTGPVQWFERDRLEDHGTQGVMAGRLGVELLDRQGRPWFLFPPTTEIPDQCIYFPETRHTLCEPFLAYWQQQGGVERFGYPITDAFGENVVEGWTGSVQYFERRRLEWHTELSGNPILQGLLGRELLND